MRAVPNIPKVKSANFSQTSSTAKLKSMSHRLLLLLDFPKTFSFTSIPPTQLFTTALFGIQHFHQRNSLQRSLLSSYHFSSLSFYRIRRFFGARIERAVAFSASLQKFQVSRIPSLFQHLLTQTHRSRSQAPSRIEHTVVSSTSSHRTPRRIQHLVASSSSAPSHRVHRHHHIECSKHVVVSRTVAQNLPGKFSSFTCQTFAHRTTSQVPSSTPAQTFR